MKTVLTAALLFALPLLASEDPKLRQEANELVQRTIDVTTPTKWPPHHHEITFRYSGADGTATNGTLSLDFQSPSRRRLEILYGNYYLLRFDTPGAMAAKRSESMPPPGVREMQLLTPVHIIRFDQEDVIQDIRDSVVEGRAARCIQFQSTYGDHTKSGEVCVDKARGMLLHVLFGGVSTDSSNWVQFADKWYAKHIERSQDGRLEIAIDQIFTLVDSFPPETFQPPSDAQHYLACEEYRRAIGVSMPQPKPGNGDNVDDVLVQAHIEPTGQVSTAAIRDTKRPDLSAEAIQTAKTWTFHPATCNGRIISADIDLTLHFKGR